MNHLNQLLSDNDNNNNISCRSNLRQPRRTANSFLADKTDHCFSRETSLPSVGTLISRRMIFYNRWDLSTLVSVILINYVLSFSPQSTFGKCFGHAGAFLTTESKPVALQATVNGESKTNDNDKGATTASGQPGFPLHSLFNAAAKAAVPKAADTAAGGHDAFRYEWGRWVDDGHMAELQEQMNRIKIAQGGKVYDRLLSIERNVVFTLENQSSNNGGIQDVLFTRDKEARRFRVAGGDNWDCILHVLPKGREWSGRWPTGSWAVIRALTGLAEVAMLRGPDRDGFMNKVTTMKLRGGSDGSLGSGSEGAGGQDSVKYVGGAQRTYSGVSGKTMLLEVVLRPPIGDAGKDGDGRLSKDIEPLPPEDVLMDGLDDVDEVPLEENEVEKPPKELPREKPVAEAVANSVKQRPQRPRRDVARDMPLPEPTIPLSEFVPEDDVEFLDGEFGFVPDRRMYEDEFYDETYEGDIAYENDFVDGGVYEDGIVDSAAEQYFDDEDEFYSDEQQFASSDKVVDARNEAEDLETEDEEEPTSLGTKMGLSFKKVGGLDDQLDAIVRRVLATRANPKAAKRLGVNHVRGILLSGPPGCGKTLLARELSEMLGSREPQIVNGPEILDKFVGEAEKNVRALFEPAELEYDQLGDDSALHVIILDELDAIARRRGSVTGDTTGVRDSVVNQLLAKMDGVKEANNVLVIGLTNRPELLDPALLRPGRLEVQLRVDLPDKVGRRDILRIHTARMKEEGGLSWEAQEALEDVESDDGIPAKTEYFTGAEIAGLVRSAASFALARNVEEEYIYGEAEDEATVMVSDLERALSEVRPALGKQDEVLEARFPHGISPCSPSMKRVIRDLKRFTSTPKALAKQQLTSESSAPTLQSMLLIGDGHKGGTGATALACWAASQASTKGDANYVRLITSLDLLAFGGGSGEESTRATALVERFAEATTMSNSLLVFDDIDQICAGSGPDGYSSLMVSTLRALLRSPTAGASSFRVDDSIPTSDFVAKENKAKSLSILAATSRTDGVCAVLHELFDEVIVVPELTNVASLDTLFSDSLKEMGPASADLSSRAVKSLAQMMVKKLEKIGCKTALRLLERAIAMSYRAKSSTKRKDDDLNDLVVQAMGRILDDYVTDQEAASRIFCNVK